MSLCTAFQQMILKLGVCLYCVGRKCAPVDTSHLPCLTLTDEDCLSCSTTHPYVKVSVTLSLIYSDDYLTLFFFTNIPAAVTLILINLVYFNSIDTYSSVQISHLQQNKLTHACSAANNAIRRLPPGLLDLNDCQTLTKAHRDCVFRPHTIHI